jgi:ketosteroid isomerase-like protein
MRVGEHFTVDGGKIVRIRQIHDTVGLREAGFV